MNIMDKKAVCYTAADLAATGTDAIPKIYDTADHLVYSSPATLAYNSPGAEGFGVKRAGLSIPGSVMLIVSPGCCGRNTSMISTMQAYHDRFFYLEMDETDLITARHLNRIPEAVAEVYRHLEKKGIAPSLIMICITCVDALLGTDMERISRKAEKLVPVPVRPCYMYALTREGSRPPMVHVRQSLYSILEPKKKKASSVNFLGFFAPVIDDFELYDMLYGIGVRKIREISRCQSLTEFQEMAEANFNLVLHPEARPAAADITERLGIPYIELTRLYQIDQIENQYHALGKVLGTDLFDHAAKEAAEHAVGAVKERYPNLSFSVGEAMNGIPFEMALALVRYGFCVKEIYGNPAPDYFPDIQRLAQLSPDTRIYSNMEPTMVYYDAGQAPVDVTIGKDAAYYQQDAVHVFWNEDIQPFGYAGVRKLFEQILHAMDEKEVTR